MSGAVPPPAAHPLGRAAGVPRPVCPGCGRCRRGDPAPAPHRSPLRAGVAGCGRGGRASPGGGGLPCCERRSGSGAAPFPTARPPGGLSGSATHVLWARVCGCGGPALAPWLTCPVGGCAPRGWRERLGSGAPPSLLPALWADCRGLLATCCGRGCGCVRCVWCLCGACRGAWCCLSPVPLVPSLRCLVAVLCSPCACRAPFPARVPCSAAWFPLFLPWLRRPLPFPLLSVGSPSSLACPFSLPPPWCMSRSFSLPARLSLLLGPVRQRKDGGMWAFGGLVRSPCNILYPGWHHVRCGCVLRCTAYNIPVFALVSTCVRTLFTLRAVPWCSCPWRWWLRCACGGRPVWCDPTPSPALMAYREREEGGFLGAFSCPSLVLPFSWRLRRRVRAPSPYLACVCLRVWASIPFIPSSLLWAAPGYSLVPLMFRCTALAASCSSFVPWRCPLFGVGGFSSC